MTGAAALPQCVTLWIGPALGPVERACLLSILRQGHQLALYSYDPPAGVPDGVEVRDARAIVPEERIVHHRRTGSVALFANLFRYELQRQGLGTWIDCDVYLLAPLDGERPYLFGEEEPGRINNGILRLPPDSPLLPPLIDLFKEQSVPPWLPLPARLASGVRLRRSGRTGLGDMPWGSAGPKALTWLARRHDLMRHAAAPCVFYPVRWQEAKRITQEPLERLVGPKAVAIHLWNERIKHLKNRPATPGSFLERVQQEGFGALAPIAGPPPPVSVVMPVHNALPWLDEAVESVLRQSLRDFEFVILDDGSSDGSRERLRQWARLDSRIRLIESDCRLGPVASSSRVVAESRAALVARMDADDVALPHRLEWQMEVMAAHPDAVMAGALYEVVDAEGRRLRPADYPRLLRKSSFAPFSHPTIMFRRNAYDRIGGYSSQAHLWEDVDLFVRFAREGRVLVIPEALIKVRRTQKSTRFLGGDEPLDRSMDAMYRSIDNEPPGAGADGSKLRPASFIASGSVELWAGRSPRVFGRLLRRGAIGWNWESLTALGWAAWAEVSPRTLRSALRLRLAVRNPLARRRLGPAPLFEWRPGEPPRPA